MLSGVGADLSQHSHNNIHIQDVHDKDSMDQRNTENEHKTPHLRDYTGSLSFVLIHHSLLLSVTNWILMQQKQVSIHSHSMQKTRNLKHKWWHLMSSCLKDWYHDWLSLKYCSNLHLLVGNTVVAVDSLHRNNDQYLHIIDTAIINLSRANI